MKTLILSADFVPFSLRSEGASDVGRVRQTNEDRWGIDENLALFIVADGMGGHVAGEVAAQIAVETLGAQLTSELESEIAPELAFQKALEATSRRVFEQAQTRAEWAGMGATVVVLWIVGNRAVVAHLGDSRAYLWRQKLEILTTDHSLVELLVESGDLTREEAQTHPMRHQITRFCGMEGEAVADVSSREIEIGDVLLLLSDGVSNELGDAQLGLLLGEEKAAQQIVAAAIEAGGRDNATALVVRVESAPPNRLETLILEPEGRSEIGENAS